MVSVFQIFFAGLPWKSRDESKPLNFTFQDEISAANLLGFDSIFSDESTDAGWSYANNGRCLW